MQENLFTFAKPEDFIPADHPLRMARILFAVPPRARA